MGINDFKKCRICGHLFQYPGFGPQMCPACREEDEELFRRVKNYLRDNPGRTLMQTSEDCGVEVERIRAWLRDERLEYAEVGDTGLVCERCGKPLASGKLCDDCRQSLNRAAGEMMRSVETPKPIATQKEDHRDKMRFLGGRR